MAGQPFEAFRKNRKRHRKSKNKKRKNHRKAPKDSVPSGTQELRETPEVFMENDDLIPPIPRFPMKKFALKLQLNSSLTASSLDEAVSSSGLKNLSSSSSCSGGFKQFAGAYPQLCESSEGMTRLPQSLSQPCLSQPNGDGITLITPNIYLGSQMDSLDEKMLKALDISAVINLSVTCPKSVCIKEDKNFMRIPVNDSYQEKLSPYFPKAFEFLERCRKSGKKVLIHCLAGISRSPTLCISYIMRYMQMGSDDAYRYVKERRPSISPNFNFMGQLLEYENVLIKDQVLRPDQASRPHRHHIDYCGPSDLCPPKVPKSASSHCVFSPNPEEHHLLPASPSASDEDSVVSTQSEPEPSTISEPESTVITVREMTTVEELPTMTLTFPAYETANLNSNGKRMMAMDTGLPPRPKALGLPIRMASAAVELPSPSTELSRLSFDGAIGAGASEVPATPILNFTNPCFTSPVMPVAPTPTAMSSESSFSSSFESSSSSISMVSQVENPFFSSMDSREESSSSSSSSSSSGISSGSGSQSAPVLPRCRVRGFFKVFSKKTPSSSTPSTSGISRAARPECLRSSGVIISAPVLATTEEEEVESPESGFQEEEEEVREDDSVSIASASSLEIVCQ